MASTFAPLASFVLRIAKRAGVVDYELQEVRTWGRRRFATLDGLVAFLRKLEASEGAAADIAPKSGGVPSTDS